MNKKLPVLMSATMLLGSIAPAVANAEISITQNGVEYMKRYSSTDRFKTAVDVSKSNFGANTSNLIIVNGANPADALSGGPLAAKLNAPILLVNRDSISNDTINEIVRLNPNKVYILGGTGSVSTTVENAIKSKLKATGTINRISGKDRYETSVKIAEELVGNDRTAGTGFANGATNKFPDALSASALLGKKRMPLILTDGRNIPNGAEGYKKNPNNYIIGGVNSINISGISGKRLSGSDRYETSASVAMEGYKISETPTRENSCIIVDGRNYPDALTSISLSKRYDAPVLLVDKTLPATIAKYISSQERDRGYIVGGMNSVTQSVQNSVLKILTDNYAKNRNGENVKRRNARNKLRDSIIKLDSMVGMLEKKSINEVAINSYKEMRDDYFKKYVSKELSELSDVSEKDFEKKVEDLQNKFDDITKVEDTQYYNILAKAIVDGRARLAEKTKDKAIGDYSANQKEFYNMLKKGDELQTKSGKNKERIEMAYDLNNYKVSASSTSSTTTTTNWNQSIKTADKLMNDINKDLTGSKLMLEKKEQLRYALEEAKKSQTSSNIEALNDKIDEFNTVYEDYKNLENKIAEVEKALQDNKSVIDHKFSSNMLKDVTLGVSKNSLESDISAAKKTLKTFDKVSDLRNGIKELNDSLDVFKDKVYLFKVIDKNLDKVLKTVEATRFSEEKLNKITDRSKVEAYNKALESIKYEKSLLNDAVAINVPVSEFNRYASDLKSAYDALKLEYDKIK